MPQFENAFVGKLTMFDAKEKKSERSPDKTGNIEIELAEAVKLAEWLMAQPGEDNYNGDPVVKINVVAWIRQSQKNPEFKFISGLISAQKTETASDSVAAPPF